MMALAMELFKHLFLLKLSIKSFCFRQSQAVVQPVRQLLFAVLLNGLQSLPWAKNIRLWSHEFIQDGETVIEDTG